MGFGISFLLLFSLSLLLLLLPLSLSLLLSLELMDCSVRVVFGGPLLICTPGWFTIPASFSA